jgi:hypothetical protein
MSTPSVLSAIDKSQKVMLYMMTYKYSYKNTYNISHEDWI